MLPPFMRAFHFHVGLCYRFWRGATTISKLAFGPLTASRRSDLDQALAKLDTPAKYRWDVVMMDG